jgi:hypothetical protein
MRLRRSASLSSVDGVRHLAFGYWSGFALRAAVMPLPVVVAARLLGVRARSTRTISFVLIPESAAWIV